jgi:hypothetical protein
VVFSVQAGVAIDEDDDDIELGVELLDWLERDALVSTTELEMLEREELLTDDGEELTDDAVTAPHRLPVKAGTSAAAAPLVP